MSVDEYIGQLDEHHKAVLDIAVLKLGSSFNIARSNGYKSWLAKRSTQPPPVQEPISTPQSQPQDQPAPLQTTVKKRKPIKKTVDTSKSPPTIRQPAVDVDDTIKDCLTSDVLTTNLISKMVSHQVSRESLATLESDAAIYTIILGNKVVFVGTTTDVKKNVKLALKGLLKNEEVWSNHIEVKQCLTSILAVKKPTQTFDPIPESVLRCLVFKEDQNKIRIKAREMLKNVFKLTGGE